MFEDVRELRDARKRYNGKMFASKSGRIFRGLDELEAEALKDGALPQRTKELIGLALSIADGCHGWIEYHVGSAADHGATRDEIVEATAVALALKGAASQWSGRYVFKVMDDLGI